MEPLYIGSEAERAAEARRARQRADADYNWEVMQQRRRGAPREAVQAPSAPPQPPPQSYAYSEPPAPARDPLPRASSLPPAGAAAANARRSMEGNGMAGLLVDAAPGRPPEPPAAPPRQAQDRPPQRQRTPPQPPAAARRSVTPPAKRSTPAGEAQPYSQYQAPSLPALQVQQYAQPPPLAPQPPAPPPPQPLAYGAYVPAALQAYAYQQERVLNAGARAGEAGPGLLPLPSFDVDGARAAAMDAQRVASLESELRGVAFDAVRTRQELEAKLLQSEERLRTEMEMRLRLERDLAASAEALQRRIASLEKNSQRGEERFLEVREALRMQEAVSAELRAALQRRQARDDVDAASREAEQRAQLEKHAPTLSLLDPFGLERAARVEEQAAEAVDVKAKTRERVSSLEARLAAQERAAQRREGEDAARQGAQGRDVRSMLDRIDQLSQLCSALQAKVMQAEGMRDQSAVEARQGLEALRHALSEREARTSERLESVLSRATDAARAYRDEALRAVEAVRQRDDVTVALRAAAAGTASEGVLDRFDELARAIRTLDDARQRFEERTRKELDERQRAVEAALAQHNEVRAARDREAREEMRNGIAQLQESLFGWKKHTDSAIGGLEEVLRAEIKARMKGEDGAAQVVGELEARLERVVAQLKEEAMAWARAKADADERARADLEGMVGETRKALAAEAEARAAGEAEAREAVERARAEAAALARAAQEEAEARARAAEERAEAAAAEATAQCDARVDGALHTVQASLDREAALREEMRGNVSAEVESVQAAVEAAEKARAEAHEKLQRDFDAWVAAWEHRLREEAAARVEGDQALVAKIAVLDERGARFATWERTKKGLAGLRDQLAAERAEREESAGALVRAVAELQEALERGESDREASAAAARLLSDAACDAVLEVVRADVAGVAAEAAAAREEGGRLRDALEALQEANARAESALASALQETDVRLSGRLDGAERDAEGHRRAIEAQAAESANLVAALERNKELHVLAEGEMRRLDGELARLTNATSALKVTWEGRQAEFLREVARVEGLAAEARASAETRAQGAEMRHEVQLLGQRIDDLQRSADRAKEVAEACDRRVVLLQEAVMLEGRSPAPRPAAGDEEAEDGAVVGGPAGQGMKARYVVGELEDIRGALARAHKDIAALKDEVAAAAREAPPPGQPHARPGSGGSAAAAAAALMEKVRGENERLEQRVLGEVERRIAVATALGPPVAPPGEGGEEESGAPGRGGGLQDSLPILRGDVARLRVDLETLRAAVDEARLSGEAGPGPGPAAGPSRAGRRRRREPGGRRELKELDNREAENATRLSDDLEDLSSQIKDLLADLQQGGGVIGGSRGGGGGDPEGVDSPAP
eukprot:tig00021332_g20324.t1